MSLLTDNVIPGNHGTIFGTNATEDSDLMEIKTSLLELDGIKDVLLNTEIFPREFTVHTTKMISVTDIENKVKSVGFHAIPKDLFEL
ncbi:MULTISPECIES: heavy-metal-associated domain-containing protein [Flavobacterium]|uniref:Heavy-metal-associated domain-containing protein n=1 Tax=Flavobacterium rhamnosiphilum TaxID=2541724 RepID=A0A4R5F374_9FLAO|nr:heavy-metal-associated domain-containing protein [Flavobacterium rhamnosiphilum]TDE41943.1 heavy-metal-associated domain-containing protein [Flavobacterium rhamnosiphilum]